DVARPPGQNRVGRGLAGVVAVAGDLGVVRVARVGGDPTVGAWIGRREVGRGVVAVAGDAGRVGEAGAAGAVRVVGAVGLEGDRPARVVAPRQGRGVGDRATGGGLGGGARRKARGDGRDDLMGDLGPRGAVAAHRLAGEDLVARAALVVGDGERHCVGTV